MYFDRVGMDDISDVGSVFKRSHISDFFSYKIRKKGEGRSQGKKVRVELQDMTTFTLHYFLIYNSRH